jgi:hypothetical protein
LISIFKGYSALLHKKWCEIKDKFAAATNLPKNTAKTQKGARKHP